MTLKVYDVLGRKLETLVSGDKASGNYKVVFYKEKYSSGIYLYVMHAGNYTVTKKLILIK